jgi:hypothetical protein
MHLWFLFSQLKVIDWYACLLSILDIRAGWQENLDVFLWVWISRQYV